LEKNCIEGGNILSIIDIKNVTKVFGKYNNEIKNLLEENESKDEILSQTGSTVAVKDVSFSIDEGEVFVVMGLSGSGKSTLIRLINRLIAPSAGSIVINDQNVVDMSPKKLREFRRENFSMVFQSFALFPFKTILENAAFGLEVRKVDKAKRLKKAEEALSLVGLRGYENQYPSQLSGGMQQRVGLARALANDTDILLMDEAFSALDPLIRKEMQDELLQIQKNMKKTIIFITHDLDEALNIGDRIALMKDGAISQVGSAVDIVTNPANEYVKSFVKDINQSKVLRVKHIMEQDMDLGTFNVQDAVDEETLLVDSYKYLKTGAVTVPVKRGDKIVGVLKTAKIFKVLDVETEVNVND
jgi:glycine betaine/proline transport system ATP-binding protein